MKYTVTVHHPEQGLVAFSQGEATAREAKGRLEKAVACVREAPLTQGRRIVVQATFGRRPNKRSYVGGPEVVAEIVEKEALR